MKKIFIIILSVICLVSCFVIPVSAVESDSGVEVNNDFISNIGSIFLNAYNSNSREAFQFDVTSLLSDELDEGKITLNENSVLHNYVNEVLPNYIPANIINTNKCTITLSFHLNDSFTYDAVQSPFYRVLYSISDSDFIYQQPFGMVSCIATSDVLDLPFSYTSANPLFNFESSIPYFDNLTTYTISPRSSSEPEYNTYWEYRCYQFETGNPPNYFGNRYGLSANTFVFYFGNLSEFNNSSADLILGVPSDKIYQNIYDKGYVDGYKNGYNVGYTDGYYSDTGNYGFSQLINAVIDVPVRTFASLFNFDVLGVNLLDFIYSILTILCVVAVVKRVM